MTEPTLFTAFMDMLDRTGLKPVGETFEVHQKERQLMTALESVRNFPVERLPEIEAWILQPRDIPISRVNTILQEMSRRLAQGTGKKDTVYDDAFINAYRQRQIDRTGDCECERCEQYIGSLV